MSTAEINGTEIFYEIEGNGVPCLVMHGGLGLDHTYFLPWLDPLCDLYRFVFYDHRGNGRSASTENGALTFDRLCADADALRACLSIERIAVLGHSIGSFVALEYALRFPERVSQLILVSTAPSFDYIEEVMANARGRCTDPEVLAALAAAPGPEDADFERQWQTILPLYFHDPDLQTARAAFEKTVYRTAAAACNMDLYAAYNVASRLREIQAPTLVIAGDDDFISPPSQARRLMEGLPRGTVERLPSAGHFPFIEKPVEFVTAVRTWFSASFHHLINDNESFRYSINYP